MEEYCGVFGIFSNENCAHKILSGIDFLQHRGQEYCGIATVKNEKIDLTTHKGRVRDRFTDQELNSLGGSFGIGHVSLNNRQPIKLESNLGNFSSCFNGNIINDTELFNDLKSRGHSFSITSHIELISKIIGEGDTLINGIKILADRVKGSYSLVILTKEGIYAVRDPQGFKPLILGKGNGDFVVASESRAIESSGMEIERDVNPGEVVLINENGFHSLEQIKCDRISHCAFEWAYIASIDSILRARSRNGSYYLRINLGYL